jgi:hypothetical protein
MARVLHVFKGDHAPEAAAVIGPQAAAGDEITVALVGGGSAPLLPPGVTLHRVPEDVSYDGLLELIFAADHVITW